MPSNVHHDRINVAFLFDRAAIFPPSIDDMKTFYVSKELVRRGANVTWLQFKGQPAIERKDGIAFVSLHSRMNDSQLRPFFMVFAMLAYCLSSHTNIVYIDEWLMFRSEAFWQLVLRVTLKIAGLKVVFDLRDPYIDYQIAYGKLRLGSFRHALLRLQYSLIYRLTDLIILPSKIYAKAYVEEEGIASKKIIGVPRGIDSELFNPKVNSESIKRELNLQGEFVIGWFGMMHKYRLIDEILVPMIKEIRNFIPTAHILIGGKGEMKRSFETLRAEKPNSPFTMLGLIPYLELPLYIGTCDVLLCPVDPSFRFTRNSVWLKILESLAVGRPVVATRTGLADGDFKDLRGIVWAEPTPQNFMQALKEIHDNYSHYYSLASSQASLFRDYSTSVTMSRLVDSIEQLAKK